MFTKKKMKMHNLREPHMAKASRDVEALTKESKSGIKSCNAEKLKIELYEFGEVEALF